MGLEASASGLRDHVSARGIKTQSNFQDLFFPPNLFDLVENKPMNKLSGKKIFSPSIVFCFCLPFAWISV